ncbi:MAG: flagellar protein FlaG, partial [Shewanella sp.]
MDINIASTSMLVSNRVDLAQVPLKTPTADVELKRNAAVSAVEQSTEQSGTEDEQNPGKLTQVATELSDMMSMMRKGLAFKVDENS